jgi:hypothetical protein
MVHTWDPSYTGGIGRRIMVSDQPRKKKCKTLSEKTGKAKTTG